MYAAYLYIMRAALRDEAALRQRDREPAGDERGPAPEAGFSRSWWRRVRAAPGPGRSDIPPDPNSRILECLQSSSPSWSSVPAPPD